MSDPDYRRILAERDEARADLARVRGERDRLRSGIATANRLAEKGGRDLARAVKAESDRDTLQQQLTAAERHGDILVGEVDAMQRQLDEARELSNRIYPCDDCGKLRSKAEGGTVFTICDECWDRHRAAIAADERGRR